MLYHLLSPLSRIAMLPPTAELLLPYVYELSGALALSPLLEGAVVRLPRGVGEPLLADCQAVSADLTTSEIAEELRDLWQEEVCCGETSTAHALRIKEHAIQLDGIILIPSAWSAVTIRITVDLRHPVVSTFPWD